MGVAFHSWHTATRDGHYPLRKGPSAGVHRGRATTGTPWKARGDQSAAENIYPAEVEAALNSQDSVRESAVIGIADPTWGQSVCAIVVLNDGAEITEAELIESVKSRIASYKKPKSIVFRTEPLPRLGWPIDYETLDAEYDGGGYPGSG